MNRLITTIRIVYRIILMLLVIIPSSLFTLFGQHSTMPTSGLSSIVTRLFHRSLSKALGIRLIITGTPNREATLFVSNHISWTDILIIGQIIPTHFLSMVEVKRWPVAGWLATRAGTLYIERGGRKASDRAVADISDALRQKHNVVIFPEGRTTDGNMRKFHSRLIQSAIETSSEVQAIALKYVNGDSTLANPAVLFNNDITFPQSLFNILSQPCIEVEAAFLKPFSADGLTRDEISAQAETQVRDQLGKP